MPQLLYLYEQERPNGDVELAPETLFSVLSENMTVSYWKQIYDRIKGISKKDCDGVVVTHGTDTLAYSAAFLSFMLKDIDVPILLVSSDYPLDDCRSNGLPNFIAAVDFISNVGTKGLFVPFYKRLKKNETQTIIHLGTRLMQAQPFVHCFNSLGNVAYGRICEGVFQWHNHENNPTPDDVQSPSEIVIPCFPEEKKILYLNAYPGLDYEIMDFREKPDAIIHCLFHSGTACATPEYDRNSVVAFAKRCIGQGIDFYAAPYDSRHPMYSSSKVMADTGIRFINNISSVAAYTKLLIAYGSFTNGDERRFFIDNNIACEQFC